MLNCLNRRSGSSRIVTIGIALALTIGLTTAISLADARGGGQLAHYFEEYAGGGSCKWRTPEGRSFHLLLMLGLLVWPAGVVAFAVTLVELASTCADRSRRLRAMVTVCVVVAIVALAFTRLASLHAVAGARAECHI